MPSRRDLEYWAGSGYGARDKGRGPSRGLPAAVVEPSIERDSHGRRGAGSGTEDGGETKRAEAWEGGAALPDCAATAAVTPHTRESCMEWLERPSEEVCIEMEGYFFLKLTPLLVCRHRHHRQNCAPPLLLGRPLPGPRALPSACAQM